jgi:hypothetical protein
LNSADADDEVLDALPVMAGWVRGVLVGLVLGLTAVFAVAIKLDPYERDDEGRIIAARRQETHRQLGLPPCTFYAVTRLPCPSCGMTTSFALLMHGDLAASLRANAVGTLLAVFCLAVIPWGLASVYLGRTLFVRSVERTITFLVLALLVLMMLRWVIVVCWMWSQRG